MRHALRRRFWRRSFSCWDQFLCLGFAQLTYRESLRDIEACLRSVQGKLYHMGFRGRVSRSTLADANEAHDWRIYADFAQVLIATARPCTRTSRSASIWTAPSMRSTRRPSICACPCFRGRGFGRQRRGEDAHAAGPAWHYPHFH